MGDVVSDVVIYLPLEEKLLRVHSNWRHALLRSLRIKPFLPRSKEKRLYSQASCCGDHPKK